MAPYTQRIDMGMRGLTRGPGARRAVPTPAFCVTGPHRWVIGVCVYSLLAPGLAVADEAGGDGGGLVVRIDIQRLGQELGLLWEDPLGCVEGLSLFVAGDSPVDHIDIGVHERPEDARPAACLGRGSDLAMALATSEGDGPGEERWWGIGSSGNARGVFWFRRANVLCHVCTKHDDRQAALELAERIDGLIQASTEVAPRGETVTLPGLEFAVVGTPGVGRRVRVEFRVTDGPLVYWWRDVLCSEPMMAGGCAVDCGAPGEQSVTFRFVTEACVVVKAVTKFTVPEPDDDKE